MSETGFPSSLRRVASLTSICNSTIDTVTCSSLGEQSRGEQNPSESNWAFFGKGELYGRQHERKQLIDAFERRFSCREKSQFILLSGISGVGKTALARNTFEQPASTIFMMGAFDQLKCPNPYGPFAQALSDYINKVFTHGPDFVEKLKKVVTRCFQGSTGLLTGLLTLVPSMHMLLDEHQDLDNDSVNTSSTLNSVRIQEASQDRLKAAFRKVFRAISSTEAPLVLLLNNLQWADSSSLDLLEALISDDGFLVLGTCRTDNVKKNPDLSNLLRRLEEEKDTRILNVLVENLSPEATQALVADALQQPIEACGLVSQMIYAPTKGNPFFVVRLLRELFDLSILVPNPETRGWLWDEEKSNEVFDENLEITNLVQLQIKRIPIKSRLLLKTCACMGAQVESILLSHVFVDIYIPEAILPLLEGGFMEVDANRPDFYSFSHDCIQKAAYDLFSEKEKNISHLMVGRMLLKSLDSEDMEDHIFLVVNQMIRGVAHLKNQQESDTLAALCLKAGRRATTCSDHDTATMHYMLGTTLLHQRSWSTAYGISLDLYSYLAEAEYLTGDSVMMDFAVQEVLKNAHSFRDKIRVYSTQVRSLGSSSNFLEAINVGLKIVQHYGENFPSKLQGKPLSQCLARTKKLLKGKSDLDMLCLPDMEDRDKLAVMDVLGLIISYTIMDHLDLLPFIASRMVELSLAHGLCPMSAQGFVTYGLYLCDSGDVESGCNYGSLALSILERYENTLPEDLRSKVFGVFYGYIAPSKENLRSTIAPLRQAHQDGLGSGDLDYAIISGHAGLANAFMAGTPLSELEVEIKAYLSNLKRFQRCGHWMDSMLSLLDFIHLLMGKTSNNDEEEYCPDSSMNEDQGGRKLDSTAALATGGASTGFRVSSRMYVSLWRLLAEYHSGDYDSAMKIAKDIREKDSKSKFMFPVFTHLFYDAMVSLAAAHSAKRCRNVHLVAARKVFLHLKKIAEESSDKKKNYANKVYLLEAEFAALNGSLERAVKLYSTSILIASDEGLIHEEALACQRAYVAILHGGDEPRATFFLERARELYTQWGAVCLADKITPNSGQES